MAVSKPQISMEEQISVLHLFSRALTREMYVLPKHPELLWQQLYNRLQWEDHPIIHMLATEIELRSAKRGKPWLKMKTPFTESRSLIASFSNPGRPKSAAFSMDGRLLFCWERHENVEYETVFNIINGSEVIPPKSVQIFEETRSRHRWPGKVFTSCNNQFSITVEDTTPKLFYNLTEGFLKISYSNFPNRISLKFAKEGQNKKASSANLWSIHILPDGRRFNDDVRACAFSTDGRHAATCLISRNRSIYIWDMKTGKLKRRLKNRDYGVTACGFSPDGKKIITAGYDERESAWLLRVWEIRNGQCLQTLRGHRGDYKAEVEFCEYSPDGTLIVSGGEEQPVLLWDVGNTQVSQSQPNHAAAVTGCQFSADGQWVVSSGGSTVIIRDAIRGTLLQQWIHPQKPGKKLLKECAVSSDRRWIATSVEVSKPLNPYETWTHVCLWDTARGRRVHQLKGSKKIPVVHTAFGKPEKPTRHLIKSCGEFHPNTSTLFTIGFGNYSDNVVVWDANGGHPVRTLEGYINGTTAAARYSPDGRWIGVAFNSTVKFGRYEYIGEIAIFDAESGRRTLTLKQEEGEACCLGFSPDSKMLVSGGKNGEILLWERDVEPSRLKISGHMGSVQFCDFLQGGKFIVTAGGDRWLRIWDLEGTLINCAPFPQDILTADVHPTQLSIVIGDSVGYVHLFELIGLNK